MFSLLVTKAGETSPQTSSALFLATVYLLSVSPNFTTDPYLKLLSMLLIPPVVISSRMATGFAMNPEILIAAGILTAGYIKLIMLADNVKKLLTEPRTQKIYSSLLYLSIYLMYTGLAILAIPAMTGMSLYDPGSTSMYAFLFFVYFAIMFGSLGIIKVESPFKVGEKKNKDKKKDE